MFSRPSHRKSAALAGVVVLGLSLKPLHSYLGLEDSNLAAAFRFLGLEPTWCLLTRRRYPCLPWRVLEAMS